jgi:hypothetical protein
VLHATVIGISSRRMLGYATGDGYDAGLVVDAGVTLHTDRRSGGVRR